MEAIYLWDTVKAKTQLASTHQHVGRTAGSVSSQRPQPTTSVCQQSR